MYDIKNKLVDCPKKEEPVTKTEAILMALKEVTELSNDTLKMAKTMRDYYRGSVEEPTPTGISGTRGNGFLNDVQDSILSIHEDLREINQIISIMISE